MIGQGVQHVYEKYNSELSGAAGMMRMGACDYETMAVCSAPMFQIVDSVIEKPGNSRNKTTNQY